MSKIYNRGAVEYIAKLSEGGLRDALTLMDKCLSYSENLTVENIVKALGTVDYEEMFFLTDSIITQDEPAIFRCVEKVHMGGKDLKQFIKSYMSFVLDLCKYGYTKSFELIDIPNIYSEQLSRYNDHAYKDFARILEVVVKLNADIKWDSAPKTSIEAALMLLAEELV